MPRRPQGDAAEPGGRRPGALLHILIAALVLLWPAFLSRGPAFNADAFSYNTQARNVARRMIGLVDRTAHSAPPPSAPDGPSPRNTQHGDRTITRSIYYGVFLLTLQTIGTLWLVIYVQALVVAWLIFLVIRSARPSAGLAAYYGTVLVLSACSSLPFIVFYVEPDVFSGAAVLCIFLLGVYAGGLSRGERLAVWLVLAASLAFHTPNLIVSALLLLIAVTAVSRSAAARRRFAPGIVGLAGAVVTATLANWGYFTTAKLANHEGRHVPPFLMARVMADGPGRDYLRRSCDHGGTWALCAFKDRPLDKAFDILWSFDPATGVFVISNDAARLRIVREQTPFILHAIADEPGRQLLASARDFALQFVSVGVTEQVHPRTLQRLDVLRTRRVVAAGVRPPLPRWLIVCVNAVDIVAIGTAAVWLGARLVAMATCRRRGPDFWETDDGAVLTMVVILAAVLTANAAVCGMLSDPVARYQARLIWLLPATAIFAAPSLGGRGPVRRPEG